METHKKATEENVITMEELEELCESTEEKEVLKIKTRVNCHKSKGRAKNIVRKLKELNIEVLSKATIGDGIEITDSNEYAVNFMLPIDRLEEVCTALCMFPEDGTYIFSEWM